MIEKITNKIAPGPTPSFNEAQVVRALEIIHTGMVGRAKLSQKLRLGEGVTRTLLKHMKKEGIIKVSRQGITLTKYGDRLFSSLRSRISKGIEVPDTPLTVGPHNVAVLVREVAHKVRKGVEQRDTAIKVGALGATTLIFTGNRLTMPPNKEDAFRDSPSVRNMLVSEFGPKENDVIIIGSGKNKARAETGAKMAALDLLRNKTQNALK